MIQKALSPEKIIPSNMKFNAYFPLIFSETLRPSAKHVHRKINLRSEDFKTIKKSLECNKRGNKNLRDIFHENCITFFLNQHENIIYYQQYFIFYKISCYHMQS